MLTESVLTTKEINPIALAFIGDGVHTLFIREKVIEASNSMVNKLHKNASYYCNANTQSAMLDYAIKLLTKEEADILRRARNAKVHNHSASSTLENYKKATMFEALLGSLWLEGKKDRCLEIMEKTFLEMNKCE